MKRPGGTWAPARGREAGLKGSALQGSDSKTLQNNYGDIGRVTGGQGRGEDTCRTQRGFGAVRLFGTTP